MSKLNIKQIYENCKDNAEYGILNEDLLNEFSFKDLKDKAKSLVGKAKDKAAELTTKAKDAVVAKAKDIKKKVDDKGGLKKIAGDVAKKASHQLSKAADAASAKATELKKDIKDKGAKATFKDVAGKVKDKIVGKKAEFDDKKDYTREDILNKVKKMNRLAVVKFIADEVKQEPGKFLTSNVKDIAVNTAKKMGTAVADFGKEVGGMFSKNATDANKDVDASKIEFDERKTFFSCIFERDDGKKLKDIAKKIEDELKKAPQVADDIISLTEEKLKKAGVTDISKEQIEDNAISIIGAAENNKKLEGEKLETKIEDAIEDAEAIKAAKEEVDNDDKEKTANESMVNEVESNPTFGKIFNTFAGLFGKDAGMQTTTTDYVRSISAKIISRPGFHMTYSDIVDTNKVNYKKSPFLSFGTIPGGLWWLPLAMVAKIAIEQKSAIIKALGSVYLKWKDKQGAIALMDFYVNKIRYAIRFSTKDFKWHCINVKDAKVKVDDEIMNAALQSDIGKKFKEYCISTWDMLFKAEEGKTTPFKLIIDNPNTFGLKSAELKLLKSVGDNYDKIRAEFETKTETAESELNEKVKKVNASAIADKIKDKMLEILKNTAFNKAIQMLNRLTANKFTDAVIDVFDEKVLKTASKNKLKTIAKNIFDNHPEVAKAEKKDAKDKELDRRDDTNTSTEIDEKSYAFSCMFEGDVGKKIKQVLLEMNKDSMEATKKVEDAQKKVEAELKKAGVDEKDAQAFGPAAAAMLDAGLKPEEIKKEIEKAKEKVKESCNECMNILKKSKNKLIVESASNTNKRANKLLKKIVLQESINAVNRQYLTEGFLENLFGKTATVADTMYTSKIHSEWTVKNGPARQAAAAFAKLVDLDKTLHIDSAAAYDVMSKIPYGRAQASVAWSDKTIGPAIKTTTDTAKIALAWMPIITAAVIGIAYKYRKNINNLIQRGMTKFKNSKGHIADVLFKTIGESKNKYLTFFNVKDMVWRCMNKTNANHQPSEALLKASLDSSLGKKFREYCKNTWDPIFNSAENKELAINFSEMLKDPDKYGFDKKVCEVLKDFVERYSEIEQNCLSDKYKFDIKLK